MSRGLEFAKKELAEYLKKTGCENPDGIYLICDEKQIRREENDQTGYSSEWDDAYRIRVANGKGEIVGNNERSVLLGVYRFLTGIGCRFLYPGREGEYIPEVSLDQMTWNEEKTAGYRHRGICIEGAVSLENVLDMIDWAPKVGFNSYFIQFREGHTFFERWYLHLGNELLSEDRADKFNRNDSAEFMPVIIEEIKKRGMLYHAVGHGWTCESLGYPSTGWDPVDNETIPDDKRSFLAEVGGKREFFGGIPLNTHLCYSNKEVSHKIISEITSYLSSHREIDALHFWLADNFNNFCECDECRKMLPSDHYVMLLNELDKQLTEMKIDTKIVFLIYFDLLWTPEQNRILNPDRFIMMFAPITRTYTNTYLKPGEVPDKQNVRCMEYHLNQIEYPKDIESNLAFLFKWQKLFKGDSFDFEYHMMWDIYRDHSNMNLSEILYQDLVGLRKLGLNGNISCQVQRSFFPNGICMYIMGKVLFDPALSYEALINEYFDAAYGEYADLAKRYLKGLASFDIQSYLRNELPMINPDIQKKFSERAAHCCNFIPELTKAAADLRAPRKKMMQFLLISAELYEELFTLFSAKSGGCDTLELNRKWEEFYKKTCSLEMELAPVLDMYYFNMITKGALDAT